ncbi:MAG: GTPase ObgE [Bacilli bacterium]|nr:GTPase ObgE [Bacilli bacterium]
MFIDEVTAQIKAGDGGDGCTSFRREKYIPMGGPDGGNGGRGSNIIFKVDEGLKTLLDLKYKRIVKGSKGANGSGSNKDGRNATDVYIKVPEGTIIKDLDTGLILADLTKKGEECIVAFGGRGGRGNRSFATATKTAPDLSEYGEPGEERHIKVELKLIADIGLVGLPSVGKSTILSMVSASKPKIAAYHFTTLSPNLGVVKLSNNKIFVVADLPGLIEGASNGEGLGDKFLKHVERTRIIAHIIDMGSYEGRDPYEDYVTINNELKAFSDKLMNKPQIIIANKMDLPAAKDNLKAFKKKVKDPIFEISALNNEGLDEVLFKLADMLDNIEKTPIINEEELESFVLYKFKREKPFTIEKVGETTWLVRGDKIEKLFKMTKFSSSEATLRFAKRLKTIGIDEKLKELGAQYGDSVKILNYTFEFKE